MGGKCSKSKPANVSENTPPEKPAEEQPVLSKKSTQNESLNPDFANTTNEENNFLHFDSSKSVKSAADLGFTPGLLPFQSASISINDTDTVPSFETKNSSLGNNNTEANGSRNTSVDDSLNEYEALSKHSSLAKSTASLASTNYSGNSQNFNEFETNNEDPFNGTVEMRTYTPFDMRKTDELAQFLVSRCGLGFEQGHNPLNCRICQTVDLSDAPLIA